MRSGLCCSTNSDILQAENRRLPGNGKEMITLANCVHWWALPNVLHLSEEGAVEIFNRGGAGEWVGFTQMITPHLLTGTLPPPPLNNIRSCCKYSVFSHWLPSTYYPHLPLLSPIARGWMTKMTRGPGYPDMRQQYEVAGESKKIASRKFATILVRVFLVIPRMVNDEQASGGR